MRNAPPFETRARTLLRTSSRSSSAASVADDVVGRRNGDGGVPAVCVFERSNKSVSPWSRILRKEVIQPQVPLRLPCYDFTPVADPTVVARLLAVNVTPSGKANSHGVTGGVYKARERIHRGMLIRDY